MRLGQGVGADQLAARQPRQVARLLRLGAEVDERQRADGRVGAERSAERRVHRDLLADVGGADLVQAEAAVGLGDLEAQQVERRPPCAAARASASSRGRRGGPRSAAPPCAMNSAAVRPNRRCSSVRSSRVSMSAAATGRVRNVPPPVASCTSVTASSARVSVAHRSAITIDTQSGRQYKRAHMPAIQDLFQLRDRVAIVTGGSRGLGEEMAEGLAEAGRRADAVRASRRMAHADRPAAARRRLPRRRGGGRRRPASRRAGGRRCGRWRRTARWTSW